MDSANSTRSVYNFVKLDLDEYEENELVLNTVHDLMTFFQNSNNCTCRHSSKTDLRTCFEKVGFKRFFERHFELKALNKSEFELVVKIQLMSFEISNEKAKNTQIRHNYQYRFNATLSLCKSVYLKLFNISEYLLISLQNDF